MIAFGRVVRVCRLGASWSIAMVGFVYAWQQIFRFALVWVASVLAGV